MFRRRWSHRRLSEIFRAVVACYFRQQTVALTSCENILMKLEGKMIDFWYWQAWTKIAPIESLEGLLTDSTSWPSTRPRSWLRSSSKNLFYIAIFKWETERIILIKFTPATKDNSLLNNHIHMARKKTKLWRNYFLRYTSQTLEDSFEIRYLPAASS